MCLEHTLNAFAARNFTHGKRRVQTTVTFSDNNTFGVTEFEALPQAAKNYIKRLEELTGVPVDIVSTGPDRNETIVLRSPYDA